MLLLRDTVIAYLESEAANDEQGVEEAFKLLHEVLEAVRTVSWVGDCFIYNNSASCLNYCVGGEVGAPVTQQCGFRDSITCGGMQ